LEQHVQQVECYLLTVDKHHGAFKQMQGLVNSFPQPSRLVDSVMQQIHEHLVSSSFHR